MISRQGYSYQAGKPESLLLLAFVTLAWVGHTCLRESAAATSTDG
jgi:hypothetical protein